MTLQQQIVESEVKRLENELSLPPDKSFLRFVHSLITGISINDFDQNDIVDGGQDKQIDTITIEDNNNCATIYIIQAKYTNSFSSNVLIQMHNGLNWIFNKSRDDLETLNNDEFKDKIIEYRSTQSSIGPSNIDIKVYFVTNGNEKEISTEFLQEKKSIIDSFENDVFSSSNFYEIGCNRIVNLIKKWENTRRKIDVDIRMIYDTNNPSLIKYHSSSIKGLIASIPATEIASIVNNDKYGHIFDRNIRRYLGNTGSVNQDIKKTATSINSHMFWYLNNGITIVCDHFDAVTDPDNPIIKIKNMQIVNGCQTAATLAKAQKEGILKSDVRVLTKIFQSEDSNLVNKIVLTTNNQNKINNRNLRSNDQIQIDLKRKFEQLGFLYERSQKEFEYSKVNKSKIVSNEIVGQAYLSIVLKKPSDARGRKYKIWSDHYSRIFRSHIIEPYIISYLIYKGVFKIMLNSPLKRDGSKIKRKIAKNGTFHISRIFSFLHRNGDNWNKSKSELTHEINTIENNLKTYTNKSITIFHSIIMSNQRFNEDIDLALKSSDLDIQITKELHQNQ